MNTDGHRYEGRARRQSALIVLLACVLLAGCSVLPWKVASKPVEAQKGGVASGAGGSMWQPVNSAAPSVQESERETWYQSETAETESGATGKPDPQWDPQSEAQPEARPVVRVADPAASPVAASMPRPAYTREKTTTTLGAHQDLAGIVTASASLLKQTSILLWFGVLAAVGGAFAIAWSYNNKDGYMVISALTLAIGVTWLVVPSQSAWWLLLAVLPVGLWLRQQTGFMKLVGL